MAEKSEKPANKESRHESAKSKYQHYQRALSCKNLIRNVPPLIPSPGQFLVESFRSTELPKLSESKSYSVLLTKNIKSIVEKQNPVPLNELVAEVVSVKSNKNLRIKSGIKKEQMRETYNQQKQTEPYFKRPISAKIYQELEDRDIEDSRILRHAIEEDKINREKEQTLHRNYFQVKSKQKIPKHIHGYNTINLEEKSKTFKEQELSQFIKKSEDNKPSLLEDKIEKNFLPTEYYLNETYSPDELIKKYQNEEGIIFGFSKWFHNNGTSSWKKCRVIGFNKEDERWQIEWLSSGVEKKVSRNNLYFDKENFEEFEKMVRNAENLRLKSEVFMKYNILINLIKTPTPPFSNQIETHINELINIPLTTDKKSKEDQEFREKLMENVKELYERACHKFEFNLLLPYNEGYKKMFEGVLPKEIFDPNPRKMMIASSEQAKKLINPECTQLFTSGLKKIKERCFLNSDKKIKILELINITHEELLKVDLLKDYKKFEERPYNIKQIDSILNRNISEFFYKINCRICDIEHHVSKELDHLYANKKSVSEEVYASGMAKYHKFLLLVNMKLESHLRTSATELINKLLFSLPSLAHLNPLDENDTDANWNHFILEQKLPIKIELVPSIKENRFDMSPLENELTEIFTKNIDRLIKELSQLKCVSKSYLPQIREENILQVLHTNTHCDEIDKLNGAIEELKNNLYTLENTVKVYRGMLANQVEDQWTIGNEIHKKMQKKYSYAEVEEIIMKINFGEKEINKLIKVSEFHLCGIYYINLEETKAKYRAKVNECLKEVSTMLVEKMYRDNEKIDKNIETIMESMEKVPTTIAEYVDLENFVTETVMEEIEKTQNKAKMLTEKMNLLEKTSQIIEYREFETCCNIYLQPLKLQKARENVLYKLENYYKKNFADDLMKDSYSVLDNIKNCEKMFAEALNHKTLEEMNLNFEHMSRLNSEIETLCQKMQTINEKESLLKWSKTNFDRLLELKEEYEPYYKLITLDKNYKLNLIPLMDEAFVQINYQLINNNVLNSTETLKSLKKGRFNNDPIYEPIVESIMLKYEGFCASLPLIKILRNPDLRDRHWTIIEKITGIANIRSDSITLREVLSEPVKKEEVELTKVSQIATKELIYEKSLSQLRREWKDVRIILQEIKIGDEIVKIFKNTADIQKKLENDILEVNSILSSSFVKFLEADVTNWKSTVLDKVYEFINFWPNFEDKIIYTMKLLNFPRMAELFPEWSTLHKNFERFWKQFIGNIEFQSVIVDVVNTRTWESMSSLESQIEGIEKLLSEFLEEKKVNNSKLRLFSNDALISMMLNSTSKSTLENIQKCFTGAKKMTLVESNNQNEESFSNVEIMSNLDEKIVVKVDDAKILTPVETKPNESEEFELKTTYQFDSLFLSIDRELKKQIRTVFLSSLQEKEASGSTLGQVQLLKSRLFFKNRVEKEMKENKTLDKYELEIISEIRDQAYKISKSSNNNNSRLASLNIIELINQLSTVKNLNKNESTITSFDWFKIPKYELSDASFNSNSKLKLLVGHYSRDYMFELADSEKYIMNPINDTIFLNICTALNDKMLMMLEGSPGSSKMSTLGYLGELMGRGINSFICSKLTTPDNLLGYLKIAASGLFLILEAVEKLSQESLSVFSQSLSIFWFQYQQSRTTQISFPLNNSQITLEVPNFTFFWIKTPCEFNSTTEKKFHQIFRTFGIVQIEPRYLLECALTSVGCGLASQLSLYFINDVLEELEYQKRQGNIVKVNSGRFIWQIAELYEKTISNLQEKDLRDESETISFAHDIVQKCFEEVLTQYLPNSDSKESEIWNILYKLKLIQKRKSTPFTKLNLDGSDKQEESFSSDEESIEDYSISKKSILNMEKLKTALNFHCGAIIIGPSMSGKSSLISGIENNSTEEIRYSFTSFNPLAYNLEELFQGNEENQGLIRQMVNDLKFKYSTSKTSKCISGLFFDCGIGQWAEPLLSVVNKPNSPKFSNSDGTLMILPSEMKIIFESEDLSNVSPHLFHSLGIVALKEEIKWKKLFDGLLNKYFKTSVVKSKNIEFIKQLFYETLDSVFDFYEAVLSEKNVKTTLFFPELKKPAIVETIVRFFTVSYCKEDVENFLENEAEHQNDQTAEKIKTEIFNVYIYSLIVTLGSLIPEESRKTFSRHFKYVLEQTHLCRYGWKKNNILSKEEENIYDFFYEGGSWKKWKSYKNVLLDQDLILLDQNFALQKILIDHAEQGIPCFLVGVTCSSKNFLFKKFINSLQSEKFTKNYFSFSPLTRKTELSNKIIEMLQTQQYSSKMSGLSNCKKNIIYVEDVNLTLKDIPINGSVIEFIREFYKKKTWFINSTPFTFSNLEFYGTLNQNYQMPNKILRYINPLLMANPSNRFQSILVYNIDSSPLPQPQKDLIIRCTTNLHEIITRDLPESENACRWGYFNLRDMIRVTKGVCEITENVKEDEMDLHSLLKYWVYMIDEVYAQKVPHEKKSLLFYLVNNVLMEEQRVRYRAIYPTNNFFVVGLPEEGNVTNKKYYAGSIQKLTETLKLVGKNFSKGQKHLQYVLDGCSEDIVKLIIKIINSFDFESKVLILLNEQLRKTNSIFKMVAFLKKFVLMQAKECNISSEISKKDSIEIHNALKDKFTEEYFKTTSNANFIETSPFQTAFQSPSQSKARIESSDNVKTSFNISNKPKKQILLCFDDHSQNDVLNIKTEKGTNELAMENFILEDLLSYVKVNKFPRWGEPKEEIDEEYIQENSEISLNRKNFFFKYLNNKDTQEISRESKMKEEFVNNLDLNIILHYQKYPEYLLNNYSSLIDSSSLMFLQNSLPEPAQIEKPSKILMTDVVEENVDDEYNEGVGIIACSELTINKSIEKYGNKVCFDFIFETVIQKIRKVWVDIPAETWENLSERICFREIFTKFLDIKERRLERKLKFNEKIKMVVEKLVTIKNRIEAEKKEEVFNLEQNNTRLAEVESQIEKEQEKYTVEKKKISESKDKLARKEKDYEENIAFYRQSMDKLSFEYVKNKERILKVMGNFESGKFNLANVLNPENKVLLEGFCYLIYIVEIKKTEESNMVILREFNKAMKEKKVTKMISKVNIETLPSKALPKIEKIIQQMDQLRIKIKNDIELSHNLDDVADENMLLKIVLIQFMEVCIICIKEFNSDKIKESYETYQSSLKSSDKIKSDLLKKEKSKVLKELFTTFDSLQEEKQTLLTRINIHQEKIYNQNQTLENILTLTESIVPNLVEQSEMRVKREEGRERSALTMSICLKFFNVFWKSPCQLIQTTVSESKEKVSTMISVENIEIGNIEDEEITATTIVESVFNYKGFILVQAKSHSFSNHQNLSVIEELLYKGYHCLELPVNKFMEMSPELLPDCEAIIIRLPFSDINKSICEVEKIVNNSVLSLLPLPVFIESPHFNSQQISNYPYIDLVTGKNNLPYHYVFEKCMGALQENKSKDEKKYEKCVNKSNRRAIGEETNIMGVDVEELNNQEYLTNLFEKLAKTVKINQHQESDLLNQEDHKEINENEEANEETPHVSEKQKQKRAHEEKYFDLYTRFFIICSMNSPNTMSLDSYLKSLQRFIKEESSFSQLQTENIQKEYKKLTKAFPTLKSVFPEALMAQILSCKVEAFGGEEQFIRYVEVFGKLLSSSPIISSSNHPEENKIVGERDSKEIIQNDLEDTENDAINKIKSHEECLLGLVPELEGCFEEIVEDYDLWQDDIEVSLQEGTEIPVQHLYFLYISFPKKFSEYLQQMQSKLSLFFQQQEEYVEKSLFNKLQHLLSNLTVQRKQERNGNYIVQIVPIVIEIEKDELHEITKVLGGLRTEPIFNHPNSLLPKGTDKLPIYFVDTLDELQILQEMILSHQTAQPATEQPSELKVLILSTLSSHEHIHNQITLPQNNSLIELIHAIIPKFYTNIIQEKSKCKDYDALPLFAKAFIHEVISATCECAGRLLINNKRIIEIKSRGIGVAEGLLQRGKWKDGPEGLISFKLAFMQILIECADSQREVIHNIMREISKEATRVIDDHPLNSAKLISILSISSSHQTAHKLLNITIPLVSLHKESASKLSECYLLLHRKSPKTLLSLSLESEISNCSKVELEKVGLEEIVYLIRRSGALIGFYGIGEVTAKIKMMNQEITEEMIIDTIIPVKLTKSVFNPTNTRPYYLFITSQKTEENNCFYSNLATVVEKENNKIHKVELIPETEVSGEIDMYDVGIIADL